MREILFRGKRIDNGEWVEGFFVSLDGNPFIYQKNVYAFLEPVEVIPAAVGQYTGLTDKNGTKIFEGDLLSEKPPMNNIAYVGYVKYDTQLAAFRIIFENSYNVFILGSYSKSYTVIGNIHDNPELLEENNGFKEM